MLFTDIVGSTATADRVGDREWRNILGSHHAAVRASLGRFGGVEIDTAGDGFLATFSGPARAVRCACDIRDAVADLGLEIRAGLHTGEVEHRPDSVSGLAVHVGARVAALAAAGEVLVTSVVRAPRARFRHLFRRPGQPFAQGSARHLAAVRGDLMFAVV